tara:strand:+ start:640 stop:903 length:264 start_codon:yes stop_codon:yes gene_type:complete
MCFFSRRTPSPPPAAAALPPAKAPDPVVDTSVPEPKKLTDVEDVKKVKYGDAGNKKASQNAKKIGSDSLKINLNTPAKGGSSGGLNV